MGQDAMHLPRMVWSLQSHLLNMSGRQERRLSPFSHIDIDQGRDSSRPRSNQANGY